MSMNEETRRNMLKSILSSIYEVSSKDYQKRIWINGEGPQCSEFDDTFEYIIGDGGFLIKEQEYLKITSEQYHILEEFLKEYEEFCNKPGLDHYDPKQFIDTPEWTRITELAKKVIKAFDYHYTFPSC